MNIQLVSMRNQLIIAVMAIFLAITEDSQALILNEDAVISSVIDSDVLVQDGENGKSRVRIVEGGVTQGLALQGFSEAILDGGDVNYAIRLFNESFLAINSGTLTCSDPSCEVSLLVGLIGARDRARIDFYGGVVWDETFALEVLLRDNAQARVFGSNLTATPDGDFLQVTGQYASGEPIALTFWQLGGGTTLQLIEIPEPTSAALAVGFLTMLPSLHRRR